MKVKIGCVIAYKKNHTNYGTALVGYALLKKLQQLGYDIEIINYVKRHSLIEKIKIGWNLFRVVGLKMIKNRFASKSNNPNYINGIGIRTKSVEAYKEKKLIPFFHNYVGFSKLQEGSKNYDAIIVGSDQVWLPVGLKTKFFNLLFVDDSVRKIAYASSFGVSEIPSFQLKDTGKYLDRFYSISVREQKGKEIVESLSHNKAKVVADPTLLLDSYEWIEEIKNSNVIVNEPYIFCYFLGNNIEARNAAIELKEMTGYKIITCRHMDEFIESDEQFGDYAPYDVDPNDFLKYINNAAFVCTDSFHCTAFSIQFHKQFMTFYRFAVGSKSGRNSRIDSLFNVLGVSRDHIFNGDIKNIMSPIDWTAVDAKRESLRKESIEFLKESLKNV